MKAIDKIERQRDEYNEDNNDQRAFHDSPTSWTSSITLNRFVQNDKDHRIKLDSTSLIFCYEIFTSWRAKGWVADE